MASIKLVVFRRQISMGCSSILAELIHMILVCMTALSQVVVILMDSCLDDIRVKGKV